MEIAEQTKFNAESEAKDQDAMILLGYSIFAILLLIAIYFGSMSSSTMPGEFTSMIVFP